MPYAAKRRVTVLLSGSGTTFAALLKHQHDRPVNFAICQVVSDNPDAFGLERAREADIALTAVPNRQFSSRAEFDRELLATVAASAPDLVVLAGFMRIVNPAFVEKFSGRLLNIHPSLLPKYPGLNTYARAMAAGEQQHGSSVHFVNNLLDGGPVIAQAVVKIEDNDSIKTLSARVQQAERKLYPAVIDWFCEDRLKLSDDRAWLDGVPLDSPRLYTLDESTGDLNFADV